MACLSKLPKELHDIVANNLDWGDLRNICEVSRRMDCYYREHFFANIRDCTCPTPLGLECRCYPELEPNSFTPLRNHTSFLQALVDCPELGKNVRSLSIRPKIPVYWTPSETHSATDDDSGSISRKFGLLLEKHAYIIDEHRRQWLDGISKKDPEAEYAAIIFLCVKVRGLRLFLGEIIHGRYFEMLGHLANIQTTDHKSEAFPLLANLIVDCGRGDKYDSRGPLGTRLFPWAFLPNLDDLVLAGIDFRSLNTSVDKGEQSVIIASCRTAAKNDFATTHRIHLRIPLQYKGSIWGPESDQTRFRGIREYLRLFPALTSLVISAAQMFEFDTLQYVLDSVKGSLTHLDVSESCLVDPVQITGRDYLTFHSFHALESVSVHLEDICPEGAYVWNPSGPSLFASIPATLSPGLKHLKISLPSNFLEPAAKLAETILDSGRMPALERILIDIVGVPDAHPHRSIPNRGKIDRGSTLWDLIHWDISRDLLPKLAPMIGHWRSLAHNQRNKVDLSIQVGCVISQNDACHISPFTLHPNTAPVHAIVRTFVNTLMKPYLRPELAWKIVHGNIVALPQTIQRS